MKIHIVHASLFVLTTSLGLIACKGETVIQPDPHTKEELDTCQHDKDEKGKLITTLNDEIAACKRAGAGSGSGGEIIVTYESNILTIKANKTGGGGGPPVDNKAAEAASKEFINIVEKSRGAIQKCYEQALKKDTSIQARTITLRVTASFAQTGAYRSASFDTGSTSLGGPFNECMSTIATKWVMPANLPTTTFVAPVSLTPS